MSDPHALPKVIRVERGRQLVSYGPGEAFDGLHGITKVFVDGVELPCPVAADDPISVDVQPGRPPTVRLTLVAERVDLVDQLLEREPESS